MDIDVVIVSFNSGHRVNSAIAAIRRFAPKLESITVVENGREAPRGLDSAVRVVQTEANHGYAAAVNRGVSAGTRSFVWLVNPDIELLDGSPVALLTGWEHDVATLSPTLVGPGGEVEFSLRREPGVIDFLLEEISASSRWPNWPRARRFRLLDFAYDKPLEIDAATGACLVIRRAAWEDVGAFDEDFFVYGEETDWMMRARRRGWRHLFSPQVVAVHGAGRSTSTSPEVLEMLLLEGIYKYARKNLGASRALALHLGFIGVDAARLPAKVRSRQDLRRLSQRMPIHFGKRGPRPI